MKKAFTIIELLTVIAIVTILAAITLPTLSKAKSSSYSIVCKNNLRQFSLAWSTYALDHEGKLVHNRPYTNEPWNQFRWIQGHMGYGLTNHTDNTNLFHLKNNYLSFYLSQNHRIYKCPSDKTKINMFGQNISWVRSITLNRWMGHMERKDTLKPWYRYKVYQRESQILKPSEKFTFTNSKNDSIENGYFETGESKLFDINGAKQFELPENYHGHSSNFVYADGHAEIHKWETDWGDGEPYYDIRSQRGINVTNKVDIIWINSHATEKL